MGRLTFNSVFYSSGKSVQFKEKYYEVQLTSRKDEPDVAKYLKDITFVIVPNVNPDGYEFTRSSTNPHIRLWRKNRSPLRCSEDYWGRTRCCRGVDLNRNFDFHFMGILILLFFFLKWRKLFRKRFKLWSLFWNLSRVWIFQWAWNAVFPNIKKIN